jgi:hypothetical protein
MRKILVCLLLIAVPTCFLGCQILQSNKNEAGKRDGHFTLNDNGIVYDDKNKLEWVAGPDKNTNWDEAKSWTEKLSLDGGGWRMPTREELKGLYDGGRGSRNMTPLLKTTGWRVWSGETKDSADAWLFLFLTGDGTCSPRGNSRNLRAFAVRSRK